ncbi:hypothetical protein [Aliihoeflea sp. 40Bstr573]|uniref:hypothetical protein n=1 Tax=Aliihoeflea sp. 40Bstr573 TaxID=2696467 RepID=UPI002096366E|nr:hypothetical protein [Aliihoeflea sp. 40Bstr573]MCO6385910.1 hypothetical protein [Aliihoeflea sp. 40Bstr573]
MLYMDEATRRRLLGIQRAWQTNNTVAVAAKPKVRKINRDKRRHLVDLVATVLKSGEASPFAFEATCRHAIRTRLCLNSWRWQEADLLAADIVEEALRRIGARRPTWAEGQPEYVQNGGGALIERTRCVRCHGPLEGDHRKFCSSICANAHHGFVSAVREAEEAVAYDRVVQYGSRAKC